MSHSGGDIGDSSSQMQAWNRTPGKPNLSNLPSAASWGGKKKTNSNPADTTTSNDVWPLLSDSSLARKNEPSQWPTPAELAGTARGDSLNDFNLPNSWNAPGAPLAFRSLTESDDRNDPWPTLDAVAQSTSSSHQPIDPSVPRNMSTSGDSAFNSQRQRVQSMTKIRNESFSSWGSPTDGDFTAFANQTLQSTSENKSSNQQAPGETIGSSVSESGNHSEGHSDGLLLALINSKECWGRRPVDQSTPWDLTTLSEEIALATSSVAASAASANSNINQGLLGDAVTIAAAARQRRNVMKPVPVTTPTESNVWSSEPPNGTAIWEVHYEGGAEANRQINRWKTPGASTSGVPSLNSPPGSHRISNPSSNSFINPSVPQQQQQASAGPSVTSRGFQNNSFFPSGGPSQGQQRFGQPSAAVGSQQPPPGTGRGPPNGMLGSGPSNAFKSQGIPQTTSGWPPLSLTPDNQSPMEDAKRFLAQQGSWGSNDRVVGGKPQQTGGSQQAFPPSLGGGGDPSIPRWPSPSIDSLPQTGLPWGQSQAQQQQQQGDLRSHKFVPWSQSQTPSAAAVPQRFHLRQQNTSSSSASSANQQQQPSLRHLGPSQPQQQNHHLQQSSPTAAILRNEVARQLMMLGFHDQAGLLISADSGSLEDLEKFLCDLRDSTGGMHPGLNNLINNVTTCIISSGFAGSSDLQSPMGGGMPQPGGPPHFDLFDSRLGGGGGFHLGRAQPPPPGPPSLSTFHNRQNPSEVLKQLFLRETHLQSTIFQLDKKKRELSMKHSQLRKMNMGGPTSHHSSSMLHEILMQQTQISQQIDAHETQLAQVHAQINFLSRIAAGGGNGGGPGGGGINDDPANAALAAANMFMRIRGGAPGGPGGGGGGPFQPPNRMMMGGGGGGNNNPMMGGGGGLFGGGSGRGGLMMNAPSPSADLAPRLADLKLSMDMNRRMPWEGSGVGIGAGGGGIWDIPPQQQQFGGLSSSNSAFLSSNDPTGNNSSTNVFPSISSFTDRRWAAASTGGPDFQQHQSDLWNTSWLLLSDISPQFSPEMLRLAISNTLEQQNPGEGSGAFEIHPNLPSRYVLVGFLNPTDAAAISNSSTIKNQANSVSIISPAEALNKLQEIKALGEDQSQPEQVGNPSHSDNQSQPQSAAPVNWPTQSASDQQ